MHIGVPPELPIFFCKVSSNVLKDNLACGFGHALLTKGGWGNITEHFRPDFVEIYRNKLGSDRGTIEAGVQVFHLHQAIHPAIYFHSVMEMDTPVVEKYWLYGEGRAESIC